jgi:hypothetical protein
MTNQGDPPKGPCWIVDQIAAAFESSRGADPAGPRLGRSDVGELVAELLEEELERLAGEPSPPAPLPRAGEG